MKILKYNEENFEFKKVIKENIKENFNLLLKENDFKKFKNTNPIIYIKEIDGLLQFIGFNLTIYRLEVHCGNIPLFVPYVYRIMYNLYGTEIIRIYTKSPLLGQKEALEHYNNKNIYELKTLKEDLESFIIPTMNKINSFEKLVSKIKNKKENEVIFGKSFTYNSSEDFTNCGAYDLEELIKIVYTCIYDDFEGGMSQLKNFHLKIKDKFKLNQEDIFLEGLNETTDKLLFTNNKDITKEQLLENYKFVCDENRIKYKLKK